MCSVFVFVPRAAAQLEVAENSIASPERGASTSVGSGSEPSMSVHGGFRGAYVALSSSADPYDGAFVVGPMYGLLFHHEAWRIFDWRLQLFQFGAAWSDELAPDFMAAVGLHIGSGVRARAGVVSFAMTALIGVTGWFGTASAATFELGGEAAVTIHAGCDGIEIGYQALATLSDRGFATEPSHGIVARWIAASSDGPDRDACAPS